MSELAVARSDNTYHAKHQGLSYKGPSWAKFIALSILTLGIYGIYSSLATRRIKRLAQEVKELRAAKIEKAAAEAQAVAQEQAKKAAAAAEARAAEELEDAKAWFVERSPEKRQGRDEHFGRLLDLFMPPPSVACAFPPAIHLEPVTAEELLQRRMQAEPLPQGSFF